MARYYLVVAAALGGLVATAHAQVESESLVGLEVKAALDVRGVENAGLQPDSEDDVSETQITSSLAAIGRLQGTWADFMTNYNLEDRRYSEFSEEDERVLLGDSRLILGPQHRRYYARFSHSSQEVSLDPLAEDLPSNRDNRTFFSGALFGSARLGRVNLLTVWVDATDIQFDETTENEALRYSAGMNFDHAISPLYSIGVAVTGYDLQYRYLEDNDITYGRVAATWQAELRRLRYSAELGANSIEREEDTTSSPSAKFELRYQSGPQSVTATYNQFLSDTSQGSNETTAFDPAVEVDGRLEGEIDQFKSRQLRLAWGHSAICRGCTLQLDLGLDDEDYLTFTALSSREFFTGAIFTYLATPNLRLSLRGDLRDFEEVNSLAASGYTQTTAVFGLGFPRLIRDGQLDLYVGAVDRDAESQGDYTSSYVGARFEYVLYDR